MPAAIVGPLLRLAAASAAARSLRAAANEVIGRALLTLAAAIAGIVGIACLSRAGLTILERHVDAAEAWAIVGGAYATAGVVFLIFATRRRRPR